MDKNLGKKARDIVTGFEGIIIGKCEYLYGCNQYGVNPGVIEKGKLGDIQWFDEGRIEIIGPGVKPETVISEEPGGENSHPNAN